MERYQESNETAALAFANYASRNKWPEVAETRLPRLYRRFKGLRDRLREKREARAKLPWWKRLFG